MREVRDEDRRQFGARLFDGSDYVEVGQLGHGKSRVAAGIDVGERCQIHGDVDRKAMVRAAVADAQSQRPDLCLAIRSRDINPRCRRLAVGGNSERREPFYQRALDGPDHRADAELARTQVVEQIRDELPRAVVGNLPAAIDLERRNAVIAQQVVVAARKTERIDRRMLSQPDFIACTDATRGGERLHCAPGRLVLGAP